MNDTRNNLLEAAQSNPGPRDARMSPCRFTFLSSLIALVIFAGVAPTLTWMEFSGGSEDLVVGTILEMRRGGPWLIPTLHGTPRTTKPPMTTWITAAMVSNQNVAALSDPAHRQEAYRRLAWKVRWPALACACASMVAAAWLGRVLISDGAGLGAGAMMGSMLMFLRFDREMTTDVQLALWVTTANALLAISLFEGRRWLGCVLGGAAIGLALMSKGPVAIAQTVAPVMALFGWMRWTKRPAQMRVGWGPVLAGTIVALAIALPWPVWVLWRMSGQIGFWWEEMARGGGGDYVRDSVWSYIALFPLLLPWTALFLLGAVVLFREKTERAMFALLLVAVPIVVMSCFSEKNERYLLPMLAPASVICAAGLCGEDKDKDVEPARRFVVSLTWITLLVIGIGLPVAEAFLLKRDDAGPWLPFPAALFGLIFAGAVLAPAWVFDKTRRRWLIPAGVLLMLGSQCWFIYGYSKSPRGQSACKPVADAIATSFPSDTQVWCYGPPGRFSKVPADLPIYLNRIVRQAVEPTTLPVMTGPNVMLVYCHKLEPLPLAFADWRLIGSFSENNGIWNALVERKAFARSGRGD